MPVVSTRLPTPRTATSRGRHGPRPYELWLPTDPPPWPGMVILHGAGSRKENHSDFALTCNAKGWAALSFDQRGHGASEDVMAPGAVGDIATMAKFLADTDGVDATRVCVRGSSIGSVAATSMKPLKFAL